MRHAGEEGDEPDPGGTPARQAEALLRAALWSDRGLLLAVGFFSGLVSVLMLTGPVFMLQVYDRVLPSRAPETLAALCLLVLFLYAAVGFLDAVRARVMARLAARVHARLAQPVLDAAMARASHRPGDAAAGAAMSDLDALRSTIAAPVALAAFDLPFVPLFLAGLFLFHPLLGGFGFAAVVTLVIVFAAAQRLTRDRSAAALTHAGRAERIVAETVAGSGAIAALGMATRARARASASHDGLRLAALSASDRAGSCAALARAVRMMLQSGILALGAALVIRDAISPGAIAAATILLGRALAPVEQMIAGWQGLSRARAARKRLGLVLACAAPRRAGAAPRALTGAVAAARLDVAAPGASAPVLRGLGFRAAPGEVVAVIGPSGVGKSTLAATLAGLWPPAAGSLALDGLPPDRHDPEMRGAATGFMPQHVTLFDGTIAENIARLGRDAESAAILSAARLAGAHQMILGLPDGYATRVGPGVAGLSGGQTQRIGLARAFYGDPALFIMDEPQAHLDAAGIAALEAAIRAVKARGAVVFVFAHRPVALRDCDRILVLDSGGQRAFGPRDDVLRALLSRAPSGVARLRADRSAAG